jgi:hypothetical protein
MKEEPSSADIALLHKATGCSLNRAKSLLNSMTPELRGRFLEAARTIAPGSHLLQDPLESDPATSKIVREAAVRAQELVAKRGLTGRGSCHAIWQEQARILEEEHGLSWYSPGRMNPDVRFD